MSDARFVPSLLADATARHSIDTADGAVHWTDVGSGTPVLFIQAWGPQPGVTGWLTYERVARRLETGIRSIILELPNFGLSGPVVFDEPAHDVAVRGAIAVLDHLGLSSVPVVGVSMGATTAIDLALHHPDRVAGLVIGSCHASTGGDPYLLGAFPSEGGRLFEELLGEPTSVEKLERLMRGLLFDQNLVTPSLLDQMIDFRAGTTAHTDAHLASTSVAHSNLQDLPSISCPVRIVHGRFDRMVPYEQGLMLASYLPQADMTILNACGHWPPFERPEAYADVVRQFVSDVAA